MSRYRGLTHSLRRRMNYGEHYVRVVMDRPCNLEMVIFSGRQ